MRQHKALTQSLLILFIINFALAAPVAVRERPEARLDVNMRRNVAAASQKRWDPMDLGGSPDVPVSDHAPPPSPGSTDILSQMAHADTHPPTLDWLWSSIGSDPLDWGGSPSVPVPDHEPPPSPDLADILSQIAQAHTDTHPPTPHSPGSSAGSDPLDRGGSPSVPMPDHAPPQSPDLADIWSQMSHADNHPPTLDKLWPSIGSGPSDWGGSPSVPVPDHAPPPSPNLADILSQMAQADTDTHPPTPDSPGSSAGSDPLDWVRSPSVPVPDHASPQSMDSQDISTNPSTFSELMRMFSYGRTDSTQLAPSHPPPLPSSSRLSQLRPSDGHFPSRPYSTVNSDKLSLSDLMQMFGTAKQGHTDNTQLAPDIPGSAAGPRLPVGSMPVAGSLPPPPPALPHLSQPEPSEGRSSSPPDFSVNPGTPLSVGSTGGQPAPPQSPGAPETETDPEIHALLHPEPIPSEFLENLFKGRIKRRTQGHRYSNLDDLPHFNG